MIRKLIKAGSVCMALATATTPALVYSVANAAHVSRTEYTIHTKKVQSSVKLILLTDFHYGCVQRKEVVDEVLQRIGNESADLIILGGDVVQYPVTSKSDMEAIFKKLGKLESKHGIYFVYGNHDNEDDGTAFDKPKHFDDYTSIELDDAVRSNGINILKDDTITTTAGITIIGRDNAMSAYTARKPIEELVPDRDSFLICVDHVPTEMKECAKAGVDLQLSGHTHGGQLFPINIMFPTLWDMPAYGIHKYGDMKLIVSSGIGVGAYPLRNVHHCEYVVINIIPEA